MSIYKREESQNWWYRFKVAGKQYRGSTGTANELDAKAIEIKQRRKIRDSQSTVKKHISGSIPLEDSWAAFRAIAPAKMKRIPAEKRWEGKRKIWENFIIYIEAHYSYKTLADIKTEAVLAYVAQIKEKGKWCPNKKDQPLATTTQCEYLVLVKQVFTFLEDSAQIKVTHFKDIPLPKVTREGRETFSDVELVLINSYLTGEAADHDFLGPIFFVGINTGLRRGDICTLTGDHIDISERVISKKINKTDQVVTIPISNSLLSFLKPYPLNKGKPVFPALYDMYMANPNSITFKFKQMLKKLKIDSQSEVSGRSRKVSRKDIHSLRHTFCFLHAMKLTPLPVLQSMVGHMSKEMTQQYISHSNEKAKKVAQSIMDDFDFTKIDPPFSG